MRSDSVPYAIPRGWSTSHGPTPGIDSESDDNVVTIGLDRPQASIKVVQSLGKTYKVSTVAGGSSTHKTENNVDTKVYGCGELNEPGGLCASADGSCLYIADTNNHAVKILSLKDYSLRLLAIKLIDEGDSSSQDLKPDLKVEEVTAQVPHGREVQVILRITNSLPEGSSFNTDAPNKWTIETSDSQIILPSSEGKLQEVTDIPLALHLVSGITSEAKLILSCVMFVCLNSGVCVTRSARCNIKLTSLGSQESSKQDDFIVNINI
nr:NHL repeat-containing protein 2-like [Cherax quadricarinatus]